MCILLCSISSEDTVSFMYGYYVLKIEHSNIHITYE